MNLCVHCDQPLIIPVFADHDPARERPFCCLGCLTVSEALRAKGLALYYDIKAQMAPLRHRQPVELKAQRFDYLDDPSFLETYATADGSGQRTLEFYLEGVHCLACLWLVEKLPEYCPGVARARLDLERSVATVALAPGGRFADCASELAQLGYRPHALKRADDAGAHQKNEERRALMRIGVAGAAAGNTMLYAVSLYGGAQGEYARLFNLLTVAFGVPALTYGAWPFYVTAWRALKSRVLSIDVPIALALSVGLAMGVSNALAGVDENYFDSLSALVFLLLLSRYFLRRLQQRGLAPLDMHFFHRQEAVTRLRSEGGQEHVHVERLEAGDLVLILPEEMVAIDGEVVLGASHVNASLLTGESAPQAVRTGHKVFAGTQNLEGSLTVRVERTARESRLGRILQSVEQGWNSKAPIVGLTHKVAKYFTATVFALAAVYCWLHWPEGPQRALTGAITLLVVTCPCALALAIPLTFIRSLSLAAGQGLIVKGDEVLEKLARARCIVLDKTGTVTHGRVGIVDLRQTAPMPHRLVDVVWTLESSSRHPVGRALREHLAPACPALLPVTEHQERPGVGVEGVIEGVRYRIEREGIWTQGACTATFSREDRLREDAAAAVAELRALGLSPVLLSGDKSETVREVAHRLGLADAEWLGEASPEEKAAFIQARPRAVMVGDGANDAVALSRADVGVAVAGAMDISLRAADAYITVPGPMPLVRLVKLARETMRVIRRNLVLSLAYNALSVAAVFSGHITPLVAAVVMPLSSLTVLLSSVWGTRKLRRLWK